MKELKDTIFNVPQKANDFKFGKHVVDVFDDMVTRSVPYYQEMQRMMTEIALDYAIPGTNVYDLGCSTGTTLLNMDKALPEGVTFVGIDDSPDMLEKFQENFKERGTGRTVKAQENDLNQEVNIENASVVVLCLTLQFIRPLNRERLLREIYEGMNPDSCLLVIEKVLGEDSIFNRQFINYYYDYKRRNNYTDLEIAQKREALENVLIPYKLGENKKLLKNTRFRYIETFFKWYNFTGMVAVK